MESGKDNCMNCMKPSLGRGHQVGLLVGRHQLGEAQLPLRDVDLQLDPGLAGQPGLEGDLHLLRTEVSLA